MRIDPDDYRNLELRAHALLEDVPLHDVWAVDLPGGGPGRRVAELRPFLDPTRTNRVARGLFALRGRLGSVFGWDREPAEAPAASLLSRIGAAEREDSEQPLGQMEGPFRVLYVLPTESVSEILNATVHAWLVFALLPRPGGYRAYLAVYARPRGRLGALYLSAIEPFRHAIVYPSLLRSLRRGWEELGA